MKNRTANIVPLVLTITISSVSISMAQQQIELVSIQDCVTSQFQPDTNLDGDALTIGVADNYYYVSLVQFDTSNLPDCARINSATLSLNCFFDQDMGTAKVLELGDSWDETTVTFNNMPYGDSDGPSYYFEVSTGWKSTDVTESVVAWYTGSRPNYGFQIKPNTFVNGKLAMFYPKESGTNVAPKLTINYSFVLPGTPTASASSGSDVGEIQLAWSLVSCANGYQILYDEDADNPPFDPTQDGSPSSGSWVGNESNVTITGLTSGQLYYLAVRAYNDYDYGEHSNLVSAVAESEPGVVIHNPSIPETYHLWQNYPNPFNPVTSIDYALPKREHTLITIYDIAGRQVKTLVDKVEESGYKSVTWDGTDNFGQPITAGVYIYRMKAGRYLENRKMVLLR